MVPTIYTYHCVEIFTAVFTSVVHVSFHTCAMGTTLISKLKFARLIVNSTQVQSLHVVQRPMHGAHPLNTSRLRMRIKCVTPCITRSRLMRIRPRHGAAWSLAQPPQIVHGIWDAGAKKLTTVLWRDRDKDA